METTSVIEELWFETAVDESSDKRAQESLSATVGKVHGIKPFPLVVRKLLQIMQNPDFEMGQVSSIIEEDLPLATSVLRVANSALFGAASPSTFLRQAVVRLGAKMLREIVVSVTVSGLFKDDSGLGKTIRNHCSATAAIARSLARDFTPSLTDGIFLAGLLHDMGKLLLLQTGEMDYSALPSRNAWSPNSHHITEQHALGFDHAVLGGHILLDWNIPEPIPRLVAWHHQTKRAYEDEFLAPRIAILRIADQLEPVLRTAPDRFSDIVDQMAQRIDFQYANVDADRIKAMVDKLFQASRDSQMLLGSPQ